MNVRLSEETLKYKTLYGFSTSVSLQITNSCLLFTLENYLKYFSSCHIE